MGWFLGVGGQSPDRPYLYFIAARNHACAKDLGPCIKISTCAGFREGSASALLLHSGKSVIQLRR